MLTFRMTLPTFAAKCHFVFIGLALALLGGCSQQATAASVDNCGSVDRLIVALRFVKAIYPELAGKEVSVAFSPGTGTFVSSAIEADDLRIQFDNKDLWHSSNKTSERQDNTTPTINSNDGIDLPFYVYFDFIGPSRPVTPRRLACRPVKFTSVPAYKEMEKVKNILNAHPEWSDEEELKAARKLGLRYGPEDKASILKIIPLKKIEEFYGPLQIKKASFSMNVGTKCVQCSFALPNWLVSASEFRGSHNLVIVVEPFFGKITSISQSH